MSIFRKRRSNIQQSLRSFRVRVLTEGTQFFRVMAESGDLPWAGPRDFDTRAKAEEVALNCASMHVGQSFFVSERYQLDGVQVQVSCKEFSFAFLEGFQNGK